MIMIIHYNFSFKKTSDIGPSIYRHPENRTASPGDHVVFTCAVEGLPAPSIIWLRDGLEVTDRKAKTYQGRDSIISELHIASVEKHHFGKYTCQAANTIGIVVSKDAMLSLAGKRPLKGKYSARGGGGGGAWYPSNVYTGRLRPEVQPLTPQLFTTKVPLSYTFYWQIVPLSRTFLRTLYPF